MRDDQSRSKGFGFVCFKLPDHRSFGSKSPRKVLSESSKTEVVENTDFHWIPAKNLNLTNIIFGRIWNYFPQRSLGPGRVLHIFCLRDFLSIERALSFCISSCGALKNMCFFFLRGFVPFLFSDFRIRENPKRFSKYPRLEVSDMYACDFKRRKLFFFSKKTATKLLFFSK